MANEQNLKPVRSKSEAREKGRKGGKVSGKVRREKKTVQKILSELLDGKINDNPQFVKLAKKLGVESDKSIKDLYVIAATVNTLKSANLINLGTLCSLLGEDKENADKAVLDKLDEVIGEVDKLAK